MADMAMDDGFIDQLDYMDFNFDASASSTSRSLRHPNAAEDIEIYNFKANAAGLRQRAINIFQEMEQFEAQSRERHREVRVGKMKKSVSTELKSFSSLLNVVTPTRKMVDRVRVVVA